MLLDIIYVVVGLIVLVWSADKLIDGAAATATHFGMSPLLVGMLIIGFGTSAPEMVVSAFAAFDGNPGIALGNAYGSNIANIGLVLAITALLYPLTVSSRIVRREIPLLMLATLLSFALFYDTLITRIEAAIMLAAMLVLLIYSTFYSGDDDALVDEFAQRNEDEFKTPLSKSLLWLVLGLVLLLLSSHYLIQGAVGIAEYFGVSDLIIGLTVIAIGTSLPELASSIAAAKKGESDIVLGNIIGSCLFNALAVVGIAAAIRPVDIEPIFLSRDFTVATLLTVLLWIFAFGLRKPTEINKKAGAIFLLCYVGYTAYLLMTLKG
ncbi:MAG: calcium/sodium antiporter [Gammaproteobacteria bacterium]|nr:MAG: calcium/sodium antiporter [Gammaproteobacteria bacterium]